MPRPCTPAMPAGWRSSDHWGAPLQRAHRQPRQCGAVSVVWDASGPSTVRVAGGAEGGSRQWSRTRVWARSGASMASAASNQVNQPDCLAVPRSTVTWKTLAPQKQCRRPAAHTLCALIEQDLFMMAVCIRNDMTLSAHSPASNMLAVTQHPAGRRQAVPAPPPHRRLRCL